MHAYIHIFCTSQAKGLRGGGGGGWGAAGTKGKKSGKCLFLPKEGFERSGLCYLNSANGSFELASHSSMHLGKFCKEHEGKPASSPHSAQREGFISFA